MASTASAAKGVASVDSSSSSSLDESPVKKKPCIEQPQPNMIFQQGQYANVEQLLAEMAMFRKKLDDYGSKQPIQPIPRHIHDGQDLISDFSGKTPVKWALKVVNHLFSADELRANVLQVFINFHMLFIKIFYIYIHIFKEKFAYRAWLPLSCSSKITQRSNAS